MPLTGPFSLPALLHWLLDAVALWILVGLLGSALSAYRGERSRSRRGLVTLVLVAIVYLGTLLAVSLTRSARVLSPGQSRCFEEACFSVLAAKQLQGFQARDQARPRLVRVTIQLHNTSQVHATRELNLRPSLVDDHGHRWNFVPGLAGVPLTTLVQPGGTATSDPVFLVPRDAAGLHLELRHTGWYPGHLIIDDPESLLHQSTRMLLPSTHLPVM